MTRLHLPLLFSTLISVFSVCNFVSSQVQTNISEVAFDLFYRASGKLQIHPTSQWFYGPKMTEYGKFMLCVDVYQKISGMNLLGARYSTKNGTTNLPSFGWGATTIQHHLPFVPQKEITRYFMQCPLHEVQFSAPHPIYGIEFYICEDPKDICVYVFTPNADRFLNLKAKVCDLLINVRYDIRELNQEVITRMDTGLEEFKWSQLNELNNERRFIMCLSVHEKLTRTYLFSTPFKIDNYTNKKLPLIFNIVHKHLNLLNGTQDVIIQNFEVLYCPLDKFVFQEHRANKPTDGIAPFYLAKSFHDDCVYKMEPFNNTDNQNLQDVSTLRIKAELCGIFGNHNYSTDDLENELIGRVDFSQDQSFHTLLWNELASMNARVRFQMCVTAQKNEHKKYFVTRRTSYANSNHIFSNNNSDLMKLNNRHMNNALIIVLQCPMDKVTSDLSVDDLFFLADSPRLGCVYKLTITWGMSLEINKLICGVYSTRYLLNLDNRISCPASI